PPVVIFGVPAGGVVLNCHCVLPVTGSTDRMYPVMLSRSPPTPTMTWSRITIGDIDDQYPFLMSPTSTSHRSLPVLASRETKCASGVIEKMESLYIATPR